MQRAHAERDPRDYAANAVYRLHQQSVYHCSTIVHLFYCAFGTMSAVIDAVDLAKVNNDGKHRRIPR